jgi:hypothetical protein
MLRHIFVALLAVLVTASMGLSVVQASVPMPDVAKMSMPMPKMAGMEPAQGKACKQCPSDMSGKVLACGLMVVCALGAVAQELSAGVSLALVLYTNANNVLTGRSLIPEPYPPRLLTFI